VSFDQFSKLPVWLKPLPPITLLGALVAVGYSSHAPFVVSDQQSVTTVNPAPIPDVTPPGMSMGDTSLFQAPVLQPQGNAVTSPSGAPSEPPALSLQGNNTASATAMNQKPLQLSADSAGGAALQKFRNSPLALTYGKALNAQKKGNLKGAIEGYRQVLHQMPDALPAHLNLAVAYLQDKQPAKAIPHLKVVAKADPKNVRVQFELAKVLLDQKRLDEAIDPLRRTVTLMPQNPQPRVLLAQLYYSQKKYQQAFDQWTTLDGISQGQGQAAFAAGSIAAQNLHNPQKALPWLRKAHRLAPDDNNATLLLGQVLAASGNAKEAEPLLQNISNKVPRDAGLLRLLADVQWKNKNRDAAITSLQKVVALAPGEKEARSALAEALSARADEQEKTGNLTAASNTWKQVQQLYPDNQLPLVKRAYILLDLHREDDARSLFQRVLQKTPKDPNALLGVARIAVHQKDYDSAYQNFWRAIQVEPEYGVAYEGFVLAADKTNQEKEAYLLLQKWVKAHPHLSVAQKALKALEPAANEPPKLTPLEKPTNSAPDINTDRPPTLQMPPFSPPEKKIVPQALPEALSDKPQATSASSASAKSRISPVKTSPQSSPASPKPTPEATVPQG